MIPYKVGYLDGSLAKASINRLLAPANPFLLSLTSSTTAEMFSREGDLNQHRVVIRQSRSSAHEDRIGSSGTSKALFRSRPAGCDARNLATEGDTLSVIKNPSRFSSPFNGFLKVAFSGIARHLRRRLGPGPRAG
jgi:hypothetical protein